MSKPSHGSTTRAARPTQGLYDRYQLKRVFYSAYVPVVEHALLPAKDTKPPLLRETTQRRHRSDSVQDSSRLRQTQARDTRTAAGSMTQEQDQLHLRGESDQQTATDTATTTKSRRGLTWWQKALCFVGLLSLTYIFYRFFKNK